MNQLFAQKTLTPLVLRCSNAQVAHQVTLVLVVVLLTDLVKPDSFAHKMVLDHLNLKPLMMMLPMNAQETISVRKEVVNQNLVLMELLLSALETLNVKHVLEDMFVDQVNLNNAMHIKCATYKMNLITYMENLAQLVPTLMMMNLENAVKTSALLAHQDSSAKLVTLLEIVHLVIFVRLALMSILQIFQIKLKHVLSVTIALKEVMNPSNVLQVLSHSQEVEAKRQSALFV